jgi:hypothetical protein
LSCNEKSIPSSFHLSHSIYLSFHSILPILAHSAKMLLNLFNCCIQRIVLAFILATVAIGPNFHNDGRFAVTVVNAEVVKYTLVITNTAVAMISPETCEAITRIGMFLNGTRPGPTLEMNTGDTVIVNVANHMLQASTTIPFPWTTSTRNILLRRWYVLPNCVLLYFWHYFIYPFCKINKRRNSFLYSFYISFALT